jgi:hypothetical protein
MVLIVHNGLVPGVLRAQVIQRLIVLALPAHLMIEVLLLLIRPVTQLRLERNQFRVLVCIFLVFLRVTNSIILYYIYMMFSSWLKCLWYSKTYELLRFLTVVVHILTYCWVDIAGASGKSLSHLSKKEAAVEQHQRNQKPMKAAGSSPHEEGELSPRNDEHLNNGHGMDSKSGATPNQHPHSDNSNKSRCLHLHICAFVASHILTGVYNLL